MPIQQWVNDVSYQVASHDLVCEDKVLFQSFFFFMWVKFGNTESLFDAYTSHNYEMSG